MTTYKNVIINSALLFITATVLQMTLHELGHFSAGILVHEKGTVLYHNSVAHAAAFMPGLDALFVAGAGPLVSLLAGVAFHFICAKSRKRNMRFLFCLYLSAFGYIAFFGYLVIAPFFTYGDTGFIFQALGWPMWLTLTIAVLAGLVLYAIMRKLIRYFVEMGTSGIAADRQRKHAFLSALIRYPLFIGIVVTALLNLPTPTTLSLIYPLCSPFCLMWGFGKGIATDYPSGIMNPDLAAINRIRPVWIGIFALVVLMNRLLVYGVPGN